MLNFIGTGSAFNTKLGNNGAYLKKDDQLFMIDCGNTTFATIKEQGLLEGISHVHILITHKHADHVGSLGDLVLYGYYSMGQMGIPSVTVHSPEELEISEFLKHVGVVEGIYIDQKIKKGDVGKCESFGLEFKPQLVNHVPMLVCFGYVIKFSDGQTIYYSGDANEIPDKVLQDFLLGKFNKFYQDVCKVDFPGNIHLSLRLLEELIPKEKRNLVVCMHLDEIFDSEEAELKGFQVATKI